MGIVAIGRRFPVIAGRIAIAGAADELQQLLVAGAPVETIRFFQALGGATDAAWDAAAGVVDDAPGAEAIVTLTAVEHAEPIDQHTDALLKGISMKAAVTGGGLVPDLPPSSLRG